MVGNINGMKKKTSTKTLDPSCKQPTDPTDATAEYHQLILFKLGGEEYGIHIDQIKEVVLTPPVTKMPQTPSYVKGVANIRGNVLAIIDLEEKFGVTTGSSGTKANTSNYTLVAESKDFNVGILVREVPNTLTVKASDIDENVNVVQNSGAQHNYILGLVKLDKRLVILIDLVKIMQANELAGTFNELTPAL